MLSRVYQYSSGIVQRGLEVYMPLIKRVKNFTIEIRCDGLNHVTVARPSKNDGGFQVNISQRDRGDITYPLTLRGWYYGKKLFLQVVDEETGAVVFERITDRCPDNCRCKTCIEAH